MRRVHDLCALPAAGFRPGMILADSRYAGQLNAPDIFTRLLFSLVATGIAPRLFYRGGDRPHYEGLPVDFLAEAIAAMGPRTGSDFATYNTTNPHDDGISLDTFVDWIAEAGYRMQRIDDYADWVSRFEYGHAWATRRSAATFGAGGDGHLSAAGRSGGWLTGAGRAF